MATLWGKVVLLVAPILMLAETLLALAVVAPL
jgi:hypothetical protein